MEKTKSFSSWHLLSLILIALLLLLYFDLLGRYNNLNTVVKMYVLGSEYPLELANRKFQTTSNDNFVIAINDVKEKLNGIEIKGTVLNQSSVNIREQKILFNYRENYDSDVISSSEIEVKRIDSGYASNFKVFIQNVPKDVETIYVSFPESKVYYNIQ
ncbi:MAG TPA: hypothetical protein PLB12_11850 [Candidatus Goldiibacteriota bacterium]|nr:hypothetical protein [Candidatus Goldiibacteriota bacterium]